MFYGQGLPCRIGDEDCSSTGCVEIGGYWFNLWVNLHVTTMTYYGLCLLQLSMIRIELASEAWGKVLPRGPL